MKTLHNFTLLLLFLFLNIGNSQENKMDTNSKEANSNTVWKTYKYRDITVQLPDYFIYGLLTNSQIQYYDQDRFKNVTVAIEVYKGNKEDLLNSFKQSQKYIGTLTYKLYKENWFVVSGNQSGTIHYEKYVLKGINIQHLMIDYPENQKEFESLLPKISRSF